MIDSVVSHLKKKNKTLEISHEEVAYVINQYKATNKMPMLPLWEEIVQLYLEKKP